MDKKIVYGIDAVILVGTLLSIYFVYSFSSAPLMLSPQNNLEGGDSCVLLAFENNGDGISKILISENLGFSEAKEYIVENGLDIELEKGDYYFKVENVFDSIPKSLRVEERVVLRVVADGNLYKVVNADSGSYEVSQTNERGESINNFNFENCGEKNA